jgi:hypothetical protein
LLGTNPRLAGVDNVDGDDAIGLTLTFVDEPLVVGVADDDDDVTFPLVADELLRLGRLLDDGDGEVSLLLLDIDVRVEVSSHEVSSVGAAARLVDDNKEVGASAAATSANDARVVGDIL